MCKNCLCHGVKHAPDMSNGCTDISVFMCVLKIYDAARLSFEGELSAGQMSVKQ